MNIQSLIGVYDLTWEEKFANDYSCSREPKLVKEIPSSILYLVCYKESYRRGNRSIK